jgi:beta-lactamase regulating signal transducer with metallopeptidase domain
MKREFHSLLAILGLLLIFLSLTSLITLFFVFQKNFANQCFSIWKWCVSSLPNLSWPFLFVSILLGLGIGISLLKLYFTINWLSKGQEKETLPAKLKVALKRAASYQKEVETLPIKLLAKPGLTACVFGFKKSAFFINPEAVNELTSEEITAILLHEYAHFKRKDHFFSLVVSLLSSLLFFLPITHFFSELFKISRERVADQLTAEWMGSPLPLAQALLKTARASWSNLSLATINFKESSFLLSERVKCLFGEEVNFPAKRFLISLLLTFSLIFLIFSPIMATVESSCCSPASSTSFFISCHTL